jgi:hypothetical protein
MPTTPESYIDNPIDETLRADAELRSAKEAEDREKREQRALIDRWHGRVERGRRHDREFRDRWENDRRMARGETDWLVDTNLIGAIMEVLAAFLYARNPDVSARPSESVDRARIKEFREVARTLEIMVSRIWQDAHLKRKAKTWVRQSMTVGIGWLKAAMHMTTTVDVMVEEELNDLQQQKDRIEAITRKNQGEAVQGDENFDADMATIDANMLALQGKREITRAEGLVLDVMAPEDVIIAPDVGDVENYLDSPWIAFDNYKSVDEAYEITGWSTEEEKAALKMANVYMHKPRHGQDDKGAGQESGTNHGSAKWVEASDEDEFEEGFIRFTEIWSKNDGVVFTIIDGIHDRWARPQYAPITGRRWYPVFDLPCHLIDGERYPQGDVFQLTKLQDEYSRTRSNFAEHRERAVPGLIFDKGSITKDSVDSINSAARQEHIGVETVEPGVDLRTLFFAKAYNPVDMGLYDTSIITQEMEKVSGAQDALQSSVQVEKTATEAKIQEAGFGARSGARRDALEESLTDLAQYVSQLILQTMDETDARNYAGPEALWIPMTTEDALMFFNLEVKAGSTGKPQVNTDREIWGTLMPLMQGLIDRIGQARMMGAEWAAKPWIAMLDETMKRLDDPAEIEKFLPVPPPGTGEGQNEPSELEKSEIELNRSKAVGERADAIETVAPLLGNFMSDEQALGWLLFGGAAMSEPTPEQAAQGQLTNGQATPEAPNPLEQ